MEEDSFCTVTQKIRYARTHLHYGYRQKLHSYAAFVKTIQQISSLYTRRLRDNEMVLCVDEKTNLQPRTRKAKTLAAKRKLPVRVEHEYERKGALNLFADE